MTKNDTSQTRRRTLFALGATTLLVGGLPWRPVSAATANDTPIAPIQQLNAALLATMKQGPRTPFAERYRTLAPTIEQVFDLDGVLARSVGLSWASLPQAQQAVLGNAFRRYTVSSYLANFDSFSGQSFQVLPQTRAAGDGQVVVESRLVRADGAPVAMDYVMNRGPKGWQAVDVLMNGAISRVAVQRSDFRELLRQGGVPALTASLEHKVADLSGGMLT